MGVRSGGGGLGCGHGIAAGVIRMGSEGRVGAGV